MLLNYVLVLKEGKMVGFAAAPGYLDADNGSFHLDYAMIPSFDPEKVHETRYDLAKPDTGEVLFKGVVFCAANKHYDAPWGINGVETKMLEEVTCAAKGVSLTFP